MTALPEQELLVQIQSAGITLDHSARLDSLRLKTVAPGGFMEATWVVADRSPYADILPPEGARVEISDHQGRFRTARLSRRDPAFYHGGATWDFTARGYAEHLTDDCYTASRFWEAGTSLDTIVTEVIRDLCPDLEGLDPDSDSTGQKLLARSPDMLLKTPQEIIKEILKLGSDQHESLFWYVWDGAPGAGAKPRLLIKRRHTTPDYYVSLEHGAGVKSADDLQDLYNRVVVLWAGGAVVVDDEDSQRAHDEGGYGVRRTLRLDKRKEIASRENAEALARTELARAKALKLYGNTITIPNTAPIIDRNGKTVPLWRVEAGKVIQVRDLLVGETTTENIFWIAQTDFSERPPVLQITPEAIDKASEALAVLVGGSQPGFVTGASVTAPIVVTPPGGGGGGGIVTPPGELVPVPELLNWQIFTDVPSDKDPLAPGKAQTLIYAKGGKFYYRAGESGPATRIADELDIAEARRFGLIMGGF